MDKNTQDKIGKPASAFQLLQWLLWAILVALPAGCFTALFLICLEWATITFRNNSWLLYLLPLAGILIYFLYKGKNEKAALGNTLIISEIHRPTNGLPVVMGPLVFAATIITHLFGGSAGREGTAVQMGASIGDWWSRYKPLDAATRRMFLALGMAAGFGAVFGTPLAASVFAIEMTGRKRVHPLVCLPLILSAVIADKIVYWLGIKHDIYTVQGIDAGSWFSTAGPVWWGLLLAALIFGGAASLFALCTQTIKATGKRLKSIPWLLPVLGGLIIIAMAAIPGNENYLGLGAHSLNESGISILSAFSASGAENWSWLWKLLFTAITLGFGFKGGEVTPLFFIGATLGNSLAVMLGLPVDWMAALGLIAVFAAGFHAPFTGVFLGVELFGFAGWPYYLLVCLVAATVKLRVEGLGFNGKTFNPHLSSKVK